MKASAVLLACLVVAAATPSLAFGHFGGGPRPGGFPSHGHGPWRHYHRGLGDLDGADGLAVLPPLPASDASEPAGYGAAPYCFVPPPPHINPGPHIIYIGHKPAVSGPKVIYGTN
jgi:hypothetical protein